MGSAIRPRKQDGAGDVVVEQEHERPVDDGRSSCAVDVDGPAGRRRGGGAVLVDLKHGLVDRGVDKLAGGYDVGLGTGTTDDCEEGEARESQG